MKNKIVVLFRLRSMEVGGVQKVLIEILKNISKEEFYPILVLNIRQGKLLKLIPKDIDLIYLTKGKHELSKYKFILLSQLIFRRIKLYFYHYFPYFLYKYVIKIKPDIEVAFTSTNYREVLNSPIKSSKKIFWFHADIRDSTLNERGNLGIVKDLKSFDSGVFVSNQTREIIKETYNTEFPNSEVIYNPLDIDDILKKSEEFSVNYKYQKPIFITAGRLIKRKGNHILLKAHKILIDKGLKHSIIVLGEGPEYQNLKNEISEYHLENSFILEGTKENPYPYYKAADFYILPSHSEAYPLVIAENMLIGKPIISTKVGGISEMMEDKVNGIFVDYSAEEIANAMEKIIIDNELCEKIKKNNLEQSKQKFNSDKIHIQINEYFKSLVYDR